ncbi:MAG TPA: rod shape-determining protein RodA [Myxococcales bacterium]|jgi:rod shape determining protein RodA|nr:rod shape-determining protein RodA [Myxococcales bacterium]
MSLATEKKLDHLHWPLVLCTIVICTLGVLNLASATKNALNPMWIAQSKWMFLGAIAVGAFLFLDYRFLSTAAWPGYFVSLALLAGVAFRGKKVLGARRWLQLGPMQLQPSEFVKLALIVVLARYFSKDDVGARKGQYGLIDLWQPFLFIVAPVALIMKQPDLGTAIVTFAIAMTMIVFAKVRWQSLTVLFAGGIASAVFAWQRLLKPYQKSRILTFLDPQAYAKGAGYHAIQSVIAVGSGQWSGKGWGDGTQNQLSFLPEQHTDFIFSVWAEEHGFLGGVLLVSAYGFLVLTALDVAANARDKFGSFLAIGIASLFFWHAFINIGMVTGMLPVVGVPLPLFSYGGSSVLADLLGIGVLLNVSLRRFMF